METHSIYQCSRCGVEFKRKDYLQNHLKRKNTCKPLLANIDAQQLLKELETKPESSGQYKCDFCGKQFASRQCKYQHKQRCSERPDQVDTTLVIQDLQNKVQHLQQTVEGLNVTTNIGTQNNIQIIVNKRDFATGENTSYLDRGMLLECFRDMDLIKVLEDLHFNPDHPENHNVRIKNIKQNIMEYVDNGKWVAAKKSDVLDHLIMNGWRVLHTYYKHNRENIEDEMNENEIDESLSWLKKIYNEDPHITKELKKDAFLVVMNNKALLLVKNGG